MDWAEITFSVLCLYIGTKAWFAKKDGIVKLKRAEAISPETAVKPEEAGLSTAERIAVDWGGGAKKTEDRRYYLPCEGKK